MDGEIARRQEPLDFGSNFILSLRDLSSNRAGFTIEQFIASLKATHDELDGSVCRREMAVAVNAGKKSPRHRTAMSLHS